MNLLPQQEIMVRHALDHAYCAIFADPGLGKTRSILHAVDFLLSDAETRGVLVVAPLRVATLTWPAEVEKWFPWMKVADLRTKAGRKAWAEGSAQIYTINYENLPGLCKEKNWPVDMLVVDEIHYAKNHASIRVKPLYRRRGEFKRIVGMTGTPIANSHADLFAPMRLIDGGQRLGTAWTKFRDLYFDSDYMGWKYTIKPWARDAITKTIGDIALVLKGEEYLDIPPVHTSDIDVPLPRPLMTHYMELQKEMILRLDEDREINGVNAAALVGKLLQFTSGFCYDENGNVLDIHPHKIEALRKLVASLDETVLVMTMYQHERDAIVRAVPGAELFRKGSLDRWNAREIPVLVADPRSVGVGLNMQDGGRHIVWYTQTYSRMQYDQANSRLARTGQKEETVIHRLLCPHTIDWAAVEALRTKGEEQEGLKNALRNLRRL